MSNYNLAGVQGLSGARAAEIDAGLRAHMTKVYGTMSVGMLITFAAAWAISNLAVDATGALTGLGQAIYFSPLKWVIMFAPLAFIFLGFGAAAQRLPAAGVQLMFYVFSGLMGLSLSSIFLVYTGASIAQVFLVTSITFLSLSLYGYTTKKDLSGWGTFLIMGVIGIMVASIVNIFIGSGPLGMAISVIGVLLFAGLTAYDTQNIKNTYIAHAVHGDEEFLGKAAIMGALSLYLDFINMFTMLLHLMGATDE